MKSKSPMPLVRSGSLRLAIALAALLAAHVAHADLVGYWPMNEGTGTTLYDFSANANNGTFTGTPAPTWITGHSGSGTALSFNSGASAGYVNIPDNAALHIDSSTGTKAFTIGYWFYDPSGYYKTMFAYNGPGGRNLFMQSSNGGADYHGYFWSDNQTGLRTTTGMWSWNAWHYMAITYDNANVKVYVDSMTTPLKTQAASGKQLSAWGALALGAGAGYGWNGYLQSFTILDNALTSSTDLTALSNGTYPAQLGYWTGTTGPTYNWNLASNWGGALPASTRPLIFDTSNGLATNNNDFAANKQFNGMTFLATAGAFTLSGNAVNLTGDVTNNSTAAQTISTPLVLDGGTRTFNAAAGDLTVTAGITQAASQTNGLTKTGSGTLSLAGTNSYSGPTNVNAGKLLLNGATLSNSSVTVSGASAVLAGNGTVTQAVAIQSSAKLAPGSDPSTTGTLTLNGGLSLNASAPAVKLGTSSDAIAVTGDLTLTGNSQLSISQLAGFGYGNYTIVSYTGNLLGSGAILPPTSTSTYGYRIVTSTSHQIILHVYLPPSTKAWYGFAGATPNGTWDIGTPQNWLSGATPAAYNESVDGNDPVVFDDNVAPAGTTSVSLGVTVSPFSVTFNNNSRSYTVSGSGHIAGTTTLTANGSGSVTLGTANTFSGDTVVSAGTLTLANADALAGSTLNYNNQGGAFSFGTLTAVDLGGLKGAQNLALDNASPSPVTLAVGGNNQNPQYDGILSGNGGLTKVGSGTLTLTNGTTYLGATAVSGGILAVPTLANTTSVSVTAGTLNAQSYNGAAALAVSSGATANISGTGLSLAALSNGGIVSFTGSSGTIALAGLSGLGATTFAAGANIAGSVSSGTVNFNGTAAAIATLGDATINLANSVALTVASGTQTTGAITGVGSLIKSGAGTLTLGGPNSFSGSTTVNGGTVSVSSLSALGTTGAISANNGGIFQYTGADSGSLSRWSEATSSGNAVIDLTNGSASWSMLHKTQYLIKKGAGTLTFNNPGAYDDGGGAEVDGGTLILDGRTDGHGNVKVFTTSNIGDVQTGATLKLGGAAWQINYAGSFHMSGGIFDLNGDAANLVPVIDGSGFITNSSTTAATTNINVTSNKAFTGNIADGTGKVAVNLSNGGNTWTLSGVNTHSGATLVNGANLAAASTTALSPNSAYTVGGGRTLDLGGFNNSIGSLAGGGGVTLGAAVLTLGGDGTSPNFTGSITGTGGIVKTGSGVQTLSGTNTYSGNTTVNSGTCVLAANAVLTFVVTDASSNRITGNGSVTLNGNFTIDTSAVTVTSGSWTLVDVGTLTATFGPTFAVAGAGWSAAAGVWTKTVGAQTWTFTQSTGALNLSSGASFDAWAATNGAVGQTMAQDHDNDGVPNGIEYFLGGNTNTTGFTKLPGVVNNAGTLSITWTKASDYTGVYGTDYVVETSTTLTGDWAPEPNPGTVVISGNDVTYTFPSAGPANKFARLKVMK